MKSLVVFLAVSALANVAMLAVINTRSAPRAVSVAEKSIAIPGVANAPSASSAPPEGGPDGPRRFEEIWVSPTREELPGLIARLRAAGYPPSVIRTLVSMMVSNLFSERRRALDPATEPSPYWKGSSRSFIASPPVSNDVRVARRELSREQQALMKELLGPDAEDPNGPQAFLRERQFGTMSDEKFSQLQQILSDYSDLRQDLTSANITMGIGRLPADDEKLALLDREQDADLRALLSPAEYFEYQVRTGPASSQLRFQLAAFNPTEEEFRAIVRAQLNQGEVRNVVGPTSVEERARQQQALADQLGGVLSPERLADFRIASDPALQTLTRLTARYGLPLSAATEVIAIQREIQQRAATLRGSAGSNQTQAAQELGALNREATERLQKVLGERALAGYREYGGQWLQALTPSSRPVPTR